MLENHIIVWKNGLALLLALLICLSLFPVSAFAEVVDADDPQNLLLEEQAQMDSPDEEFDKDFVSVASSDESGTENADSYFGAGDPIQEHNFVAVVTDPTCTEQGFTTYTCTCGDSYVDDYTDALAHPETTDVPEIPATATEPGTTAGKKCAICGETLEGCEEIPTLIKTKNQQEDKFQIVEEEDKDEAVEKDEVVIEEVVEEEPVSSVLRNAIESIFPASGICGVEGDNLTWTLYDNGELVIEGTGEMENYEVDPDPNSLSCSYPWNNEAIQSVIIKNGVTSIGKCAFWNCRNLESVTIADSVTRIGVLAFDACNLAEVTIPGSVMSIERAAFCYCPSLTSVTLLSGVTSLGDAVFYGCDHLTSMSIPDTVINIGVTAFGSCNDLTDIYYSGTQQQWNQIEIGNYNDILSSANIHYTASFGTWGDLNWALDDTGTLTISGIGEMNPLYPKNPMDNFSGSGAWLEHKTEIKKAVLTSGITSIGRTAFSGCGNLTDIIIPDSVTKIGFAAFYGCSGLTSITIPDSVSFIYAFAFAYTSIKSFTIPENTYFVGEVALSSLNLQSITVKSGNTQFFTDENGILYDKSHTEQTLSSYANDYTILACPTALSGNLIINSNVTAIASCAFRSCKSLTSITLPDNLRMIGQNAFSNAALREIFFLSMPPSIEGNAFWNVTANAYYPANKGWTSDNMRNYGGSLTWKTYADTPKSQWVKIDGSWYYYDASGEILKNGWAKDSGGWCWLGSDGKQVENRWISTGGAWYYINGSGHRIENGWAKDSGGWCWLGSDGKQVENKWIKSSGAWYYINGSGRRIENGWAKDSGGWCWLGSDGKQVENRWISTGGAWYYINGSGHRIENGWAKDSGGWCWLGSDGKQVENRWISTGGAWYYINGSGHRIENGWAKDSGGWCWLGSDGKQVENKWISTGGAWYYINGSGRRIENGWAKDSGGWCWLGSDGKQVENRWISTGGAWYYINGSGHRIENGWAKDSGGWCWLGADGKQVENQWIETGGKKYYIDANGHRVTGKQTIDGKIYSFDSNGALIA